MLDVVADRVDTLPACDWVGANDWVRGGEVGADVLWGATGFAVELEVVLRGGLAKDGLGESCGECFEKCAVSGADAVVDLVA